MRSGGVGVLEGEVDTGAEEDIVEEETRHQEAGVVVDSNWEAPEAPGAEPTSTTNSQLE